MAHTSFPAKLPVPIDDGACDHLAGLALPSLSLPSTSSEHVDLSSFSGLTIVFCYPRTGAPNETIPDEWNAIPGARGCTPQACSFRDNLSELKALGVYAVFGLSTQDTAYQVEVKQRIHLPYDLLSDEQLLFVERLGLPTIDWQGKRLVKRVTIAIQQGEIVKHWYPVFPPDQSAAQVLDWLKSGQKRE